MMARPDGLADWKSAENKDWIDDYGLKEELKS